MESSTKIDDDHDGEGFKNLDGVGQGENDHVAGFNAGGDELGGGSIRVMNLITTIIVFGMSASFIEFVCIRLLCGRLRGIESWQMIEIDSGIDLKQNQWQKFYSKLRHLHHDFSVDLLKQYGNSLLFVWTLRGRGEDFWDWFTIVVKKNPGDHWRVQLFGSAEMMPIFLTVSVIMWW
ncbi:hypothetical protein RHSIM_Rhsim05G0061400 [Rhododendron simsii]|uniref:Uncharacterized protein n=1 Tax=Rhododendron simsii TaxID=118357 RepID=A0A834GZM5_RHOSS|nr:hypothetical protein RHSIM_Rhsim05G0061400 [Rhododendron simsii]